MQLRPQPHSPPALLVSAGITGTRHHIYLGCGSLFFFLRVFDVYHSMLGMPRDNSWEESVLSSHCSGPGRGFGWSGAVVRWAAGSFGQLALLF